MNDDPIPDVVAYMVTDADFLTPLTPAQEQERLNSGLPVPAMAEALPSIVSSITVSSAITTSGWTPHYREDFEHHFPYDSKDGCQFTLASSDSQIQWGQDNLRAFGEAGSQATWLAAGGSGALDPALTTYPEALTVQMICTFATLENVDNVMTEFAIWQDAADLGDRFFVGFHTGELGTTGQRLFHGLAWTQSHIDAQTDQHLWETRRLYYPEAIRRAIENQSDEIAVMWQFTSDHIRHDTARGAWLDNVAVEQYVEPTASRDCEDIDPTLSLPEQADERQVSKGINLPPYVEDGLAERMQNLTALGVNWVRLEFVLQPDSLIAGYTDGLTVLRTLDLKYFDELIDALCANQIGILGLVDYQTLARTDWQDNGSLNSSYMAEFSDILAFLVRYYDNRIGHWEIWNEPDYTASALAPTAFAQLLTTSYETIKTIDATDQVVLGGLASASPGAYNYLYNVYNALAQSFPGRDSPFDIFAVHPYINHGYRDSQGRLLLDPKQYLRYESPNIIAKFQTLLANNPTGNDDSHKEIWVTEIGWNSSMGAPVPTSCSPIQEQLVTSSQQAAYLTDSFDILFKETAQQNGSPGVTKVFWYQYRDTAVWLDCTHTARASNGMFTEGSHEEGQRVNELSPSWFASVQAKRSMTRSAVVVNWWFGLVDGLFRMKEVGFAFQAYAQPTPIPTPTATPTVTLLPTAIPSPTVTPTPTAPAPCLLGDVNCDISMDARDALFILQYDVGLRIDSVQYPLPQGTLYLPVCDVTGDDHCNAGDALQILQCSVGIVNGFCP